MNFDEFQDEMDEIISVADSIIENWHISKLKELKKKIKEEDIKEFLTEYYDNISLSLEGLKDRELIAICEVFEVSVSMKITFK